MEKQDHFQGSRLAASNSASGGNYTIEDCKCSGTSYGFIIPSAIAGGSQLEKPGSYPGRLDHPKPIPEDALRLAEDVFPSAHSILLFFSGELFVSFGADQEDNLDQLYKTAPLFFVGCPVYIMPSLAPHPAVFKLCGLEALITSGKQEVQRH